jgi:1,4-dihydroxy-2-naphthoate polyprenyltransferase
MSEQIPQPGSLGAWVLACRPQTLAVGLAPVLVGAAVAHAAGGANFLPIFAALLGAILIQIGTNLANDVFDYEKGADTSERLGPTRATQAGLLTAQQVRRGMVTCFIMAMVVGFYLAQVGGWPIVVIGLLSIASGIAYTGGPWPLGYNGLGDVFVFVFFGPVAVCGTAYVGHGEFGCVQTLALLASIPVGALATAVLVVNNVRDYETDVTAGKRTLIVRFGRPFGIFEYGFLLGISYIVPVLLSWKHLASWWVLLPMVTLPIANSLYNAVAQETGTALNPRLAQTARLLLIFSVLFTVGIAL